MRVFVISGLLVAAQAACVKQLPFPEIDSKPICEKFVAEQVRRQMLADPKKVKDDALTACLRAQAENRQQARRIWDETSEAKHWVCRTYHDAYADLSSCLSQ